MTAHQEKHLSELFSQWKRGSRCQWPGCRSQISGKIFHIPGRLRKHLRTHFKTHWCSHPDCTYGKPFATPYDLDRHVRSIHISTHGFPCTIESCYQSFPRKDKLLEHGRREHGIFKCVHNHCEKMVYAVERDNHFLAFHDRKPVFECAFPGCESTKSLFNRTTAKQHLTAHHGVDHPNAYGVVCHLELTEHADSEPLTMSLETAWLDRTPQPCSVCVKKTSVEVAHQGPNGG